MLILLLYIRFDEQKHKKKSSIVNILELNTDEGFK
jgi:hypothetical protein